MSTTASTFSVALVTMKNGTVAGHKAGCADLKQTRDHDNEVWTFDASSKNDAWLEYNADFLAECEGEPHCDRHDEAAGECNNAWGIEWASCANHIPALPGQTAAPTVTIKGVEFKGCGCGCGQPVGRKATYRPGHDARHAGQVARAAVESFRAGEGTLLAGIKGLPSDALRVKALVMAQGIIAKGESKKTGQATPVNPAQEMTGAAKVGRWTYPARMTLAGKAQRNTKRDGSGEWVAHTGEGIVWN